MEEIWKDIEGYEGLYQVSNLGRVKSLDKLVIYNNGDRHFYKGRIMKQHLNKGYYQVRLINNKLGHTFEVHRIEMIAFVPNPNNLPQVNHKDEDKTNNFIWVNEDGSIDLEKSNLEWCTAKYNINYGTHNVRQKNKMANHPNLSKSVLQYDKKGHLINKWPSTRQIKRELNYNCGHIAECCRGGRKSAYGYIWKYANEKPSTF